MSKNQRTLQSRSNKNDKLYEVEAIIGKRKISEQVQYRVRWQNYGPEADTWEPAENFSTCLWVVEEYEEDLAKQRAQRKKERKFRKKANQTIPSGSEEKTFLKSGDEDTKLLEIATEEDSSAEEEEEEEEKDSEDKLESRCRRTRLGSLTLPQQQNQSFSSKSCTATVRSVTATDVRDSKPNRSLTDQKNSEQRVDSKVLPSLQRFVSINRNVNHKLLNTCNIFVNESNALVSNEKSALQPLSDHCAATISSADEIISSSATMVKTRQQHQQEARGTRADRENELLPGCPSSSAQDQKLQCNDSDQGSEKDTFWQDLQEGRVDVFKEDLYSRVKSRNQVKKGRRVRNASVPIVSETRCEFDTNNNRSPSADNLHQPRPSASKGIEQVKTVAVIEPSSYIDKTSPMASPSPSEPVNIRSGLSCHTLTDSNGSSCSFSALTNSGAASSSSDTQPISRQCSITPSNSSASGSPSNLLPSPPGLHPLNSEVIMSFHLSEATTTMDDELKETQQTSCTQTDVSITPIDTISAFPLSSSAQKISIEMLPSVSPMIPRLNSKHLKEESSSSFACNEQTNANFILNEQTSSSATQEKSCTPLFSGGISTLQQPISHCVGAADFSNSTSTGIAQTNASVSSVIISTCNKLVAETKSEISSSLLACSTISIGKEVKSNDLCQTVSSSFTSVKPSIVNITSTSQLITTTETSSGHIKVLDTKNSTIFTDSSVDVLGSSALISVSNAPVSSDSSTVATLFDTSTTLFDNQTKNISSNTSTTSILSGIRPSSQPSSRRISFAPTVSFQPISSSSPRILPKMNNNKNSNNSNDFASNTPSMQHNNNINKINNHGQQNNMAAAININQSSALNDQKRQFARDLVERLLRNPNANLDARFGGDDKSPLMLVAEYGEPLLAVSLAQKNAPVNAVDRNGETALIKASRQGHFEIVNLLLTKGANFSIRSRTNATAMKEAKANSHGQVYSLLQAFIARMSSEFNKLIDTVVNQVAVVQYALFALQVHVPTESPIFRLNFLSDEDTQNKAPGDGHLMFFATRDYDSITLNPLQLTGDQKLTVLLNGITQRNLCSGGNLVYTFTDIRRGNNQLELRFDGNFENRINQSVIFGAYKVK